MIDLSHMIQDMTERNIKRTNPYSGQSEMLTKDEAFIHDQIFKNELLATMEDKINGTGSSKYWAEMRKGLDWFMKHNAKAYMVLLD